MNMSSLKSFVEIPRVALYKAANRLSVPRCCVEGCEREASHHRVGDEILTFHRAYVKPRLSTKLHETITILRLHYQETLFSGR